MLNLLKALRQDEHGVILSTEIVIVGSLLVIGLITGVACLQKSVNGELQDLAGAIGALDQSYSFSSFRKAGTLGRCCAYTAGSSYSNCENDSQKCGDIVGCTEVRQVQVSACGDCSGASTTGCSSCGSIANSGTYETAPCGTAPCGSAPCGKAPCGSVNGARVIGTGVPGMKVTEYPLSPRAEQVAPVVVPGCQDCASTDVHNGAAVQHSSSEVIVVPAEDGAPSVVPNAPQNPAVPPTPASPLVPVPEKSTIPPQA
ncbi:MAG: hypothetical protein NT138_10385 [Planctomycetales bacterium]|nr:hypothetical protein [Planctomycetales bacterium]